ncbi:MAG: NAD(P)H-hydrate epimerase, partial [Rubrivivax sp.]
MTAATRAIELDAARALPPQTLMARAGLSAARLLQALAPHAAGTLAIAGPGNNGGDATVAATALHRPDRPSRIVLLADAARLPPDAAWALAQAQAAGVRVSGALDTVQHGEAVLDGLLGLGAARAPTGTLADTITRLNRTHAIVLAIDVPSGLDPDRGAVLGIEALRATHTLALLTLKPGLFTAAGRDHAGRVWFDPLGDGFEDRAGPCALIGPQDARLGRLRAPHAAHKGRFGDVVVIGGAPGMDGAVRLAARAALVAGAGRVYATPLDAAARGADPAWPEVMHRPPNAWTTPPAVSSRTVVAGCGGGDAIGASLPPLLAHAARLVLDADALNAVAGEPALQRALAARGARGRPTILTPHPLEAARLLGTD